MTVRHVIDEHLLQKTYHPEEERVLAYRFWQWYFRNLPRFNSENWTENQISMAAMKAGYEMGCKDTLIRVTSAHNDV